MKNITFDQNGYYLDGKPIFLSSAELPYFRVPRKDWCFRLEKLKETGANCVCTYIPWAIYEPTDGKFVLEAGGPYDINAFLKLCAEMDLPVICRPGPYCYSELRYDGLPVWLCKNHPEIVAKDFHGEIFSATSVSYTHPYYLKRVKQWFDFILPILKPNTLQNGGSVAFIQLDNELGGIHEWMWGGYDYNPETMGFHQENGAYVCFLKERFSDITDLNAHYGTEYASFVDVDHPKTNAPSTLYEIRRYQDYQNFYLGTLNDYLAALAEICDQHELNCSYVHNSGTGDMTPNFKGVREKIKKNFLLGVDHYYNLNCTWPQNNPTPQFISQCFISLEILRMMGFPASVLEFPAGSIGSWPPITYTDLKCNVLAHLAYGMKGLSYYIFSGGPNPKDLGSSFENYDYSAPIGTHNEIRPHYEALKEIGEFMNQNSDLETSERETDLKIALDLQHINALYYKNDIGMGISHKELMKFVKLGLICTSFSGSYAPELLNIHKASSFSDKSVPLIIPSDISMASKVQQQVVDFLKQGGKAIILPMLPDLDEYFAPCTILRDYLGAAKTEPLTYSDSLPLFELEELGNMSKAMGHLYRTDRVPANARKIGSDRESGEITAWEKETENGGKAIWFGFYWYHCSMDQVHMLTYLLDRMDYHGQKPVECDCPYLWTTLRTVKDRKMLFVMNLFTQEFSGNISLALPSGSRKKLGNITVPPMNVICMDV